VKYRSILMRIHLKKLAILFVASVGYTLSVSASNILLNNDNFTIEGKKADFIQYKGKPSLLLNGASATVNGVSLINGIIEYDVAFSESRNFVGVKFRQQDSKNAEEFYIRPHQSGNPDANQYTPIFNDLAAWQLYHQGFAGKVNYDFDGWNHVKIVVAGKQGEVYINDMQKPAFAISEFLRKVESGAISFSSARTDAYIANVSVVKDDNQQLLSTPIKIDKSLLKNHILNWKISKSFSDKQLTNTITLNPKELAQMDWQSLSVDSYGVLNMARIQGVSEANNTAFATFSIDSNTAQTKALHFGYSDKVRVYVNNTLVYAGNNRFRSRDYRYLGTIGLFDTVYLPLKAGKNDITFAVSELFGGWGMLAKLDDVNDISFID